MQVSNPVLVFFLVRDLSRASKQKKASSSIFRALRPHSRASVNCWMALACISQVSRQQPDLGIEHDGLAFCLPSPVRFEFDGGQTRLQQFPKQISNRDKLQTPVQKSTGASEGGFSDVKSTTHRTPRKLSERDAPSGSSFVQSINLHMFVQYVCGLSLKNLLYFNRLHQHPGSSGTTPYPW